MEKIKCHLICYSACEHINQLFTGFGELHHQGIIDLTIEKSTDYISNYYIRPFVKVIVNDQYTVIYDNFDGCTVKYPNMEGVDFCFKRTFKRDYINSLNHDVVYYPIGFNYDVFGKNDRMIQRALWSNNLRDFIKSIVRSNKILSTILRVESSIATSSIDKFIGKPILTDPPLVLFMARLWDADKVKSTEARQEREELNQMRAKCVELLKKEFGKYFLGGLAPTAYAQKYYPQQVLENELLTRKDNYLKIMHGTSICIATTGLAGSVGWKMAEYIAGAKAIISQKIIYEYPGEFRENVNYLPFVTAEECVEKAVWLFKNPERRFQIMQANQQYYLEYIQPDKMILNSLRKVLDHKK